MIRVVLPYHLRTLAGVGGEIALEVRGTVTQRAILDAIEARYPMLMGTIRDHGTLRRRPMLRFFACEEDLTHDSVDEVLPEAIASGAEAFLIVGAIAGGSAHELWLSESDLAVYHQTKGMGHTRVEINEDGP